MSVFASLAREHVLFLELVARLERSAGAPDARAAARDTRNILLVLLTALKAHERLEDLIFEEKPDPLLPDARAALQLVEAQHRALGALREEALELLRDGTTENTESMRGLVLRLAKLLRRHFEDEERRLWPGLNALMSRSSLARLDRLARAHVRATENDLARQWAEVADYLG